MNRHIALGMFALVIGCSLVSIGFANSQGADPGHSGGHVGGGFNCTACHDFNGGFGGVELLGAPQRYLPNEVYDLTIRVFDAEQAGAGFQVSAEAATGHQGLFINYTPNTQYASVSSTDYITHTMDGYDESVANWVGNGGSHSFQFRWVAPAQDVGPVTFFAAGNAVNDGNAFQEDRYYANYVVAFPAAKPDADGDEDVDLFDFAAFQRCYDADDPGTLPSCEFADVSAQTFLTSLVGPTATLPAGYVLADPVRGGLLYDKWWAVNGAATPSGDHPLYPAIGQKSGDSTYRCKECHGWDYKGALGAYSTGSHFTGIPGVVGSSLSPQALFDLLKADPVDTPNGHDMDAYGMSDGDLWDVVRMTLEVDSVDPYIAGGLFQGDVGAGASFFNSDAGCGRCHGSDGKAINFGSAEDPEHIGGLARRNPWEFLHKTRFGHPGSPMPASELLQWPVSEAAAVGAFSSTLPDDDL